jgi:hypothetical protein
MPPHRQAVAVSSNGAAVLQKNFRADLGQQKFQRFAKLKEVFYHCTSRNKNTILNFTQLINNASKNNTT